MLITSQGNLTALEIAHLTKADEGKYTCTASNVAGSKSESLSLIVDDVILCKLNEFRCKSGDQVCRKDYYYDSDMLNSHVCLAVRPQRGSLRQ